MKKLIAFDLDGVLIDSLKNMEMSWDIVKLHHNIEVPFDEYRKHIGKPFFDILDELGLTESQQRIKDTYDEASNMVIDEVEIYEGAIETLEHIKEKGYKIAICTSKDIVRVKKVIANVDVRKQVTVNISHHDAEPPVERGLLQGGAVDILETAAGPTERAKATRAKVFVKEVLFPQLD